MTGISVLVPLGVSPDAAGAHRAAVWAWCARKWDRLRVAGVVDEVVVGHDPLFGKPNNAIPPAAGLTWPHPFSVARALNDAARRATGDQFLLFGADHVPDILAVRWAVDQLRTHAFARIYEKVAYATEAATRIILGGTGFPTDAADWHLHSAPCPGVLGVRRSAFEKAGGLDERYEGWGYEDTAFLDALTVAHSGGLRGTMGPSGLLLRELWHDTSGRNLNGRNAAIYRGGPA